MRGSRNYSFQDSGNTLIIQSTQKGKYKSYKTPSWWLCKLLHFFVFNILMLDFYNKKYLFFSIISIKKLKSWRHVWNILLVPTNLLFNLFKFFTFNLFFVLQNKRQSCLYWGEVKKAIKVKKASILITVYLRFWRKLFKSLWNTYRFKLYILRSTLFVTFNNNNDRSVFISFSIIKFLIN